MLTEHAPPRRLRPTCVPKEPSADAHNCSRTSSAPQSPARQRTRRPAREGYAASHFSHRHSRPMKTLSKVPSTAVHRAPYARCVSAVGERRAPTKLAHLVRVEDVRRARLQGRLHPRRSRCPSRSAAATVATLARDLASVHDLRSGTMTFVSARASRRSEYEATIRNPLTGIADHSPRHWELKPNRPRPSRRCRPDGRRLRGPRLDQLSVL